MPRKQTIERARRYAREAKAPTGGKFVRKEMHLIREGKDGARNPKQAIAIGLNKARKAGVKLPPNPRKTNKPTRRKPSAKRSRATSIAVKREGRSAASRSALSRQARSSTRARGHQNLRKSAAKASRTKGRAGRTRRAQKAGRSRRAA